MSGISGIYYKDGKSVDQVSIQKMAVALSHRGPDGRGIWTEENIGLGHCRMDTTPESELETQPLSLPTYGLSITADARIDNREELYSILNINPQTEKLGSIVDARLILLSYLKWGEDCLSRLLGDFSFAIWDSNNKKLFCAVDPFGVRPLSYYLDDKAFIFASEISGLLVNQTIPVQLNENRIAAMFIDSIYEMDNDSTLFKKIHYLPAAHCITIGARGSRLRKYWNPEDVQPITLGSDQEYSECFSSIFRESVECRLRSVGPSALALSGGIDSASIAGMSKSILDLNDDVLHTFSTISHDESQCKETAFIRSSISTLASLSEVYTNKVLNSYKDEILNALDGCHHPGGIMDIFLMCLYKHVSSQGYNVMLDGAEGDTVLGMGPVYMAHMVRSLRIFQAYKEAKNYSKYTENNTEGGMNFFIAAVRAALVPDRVRQVLFRTRQLRTDKDSLAFLTLRNDFFQRININELIMQSRENSGTGLASTVKQQHMALFNRPFMSRMYKGLDMLSSQFGLELRHPYLDKRLVEFALSLPVEQKNHDGWEKWILRKSPIPHVSEEVRWRRGRDHVGWQFVSKFKGMIDSEIESAIFDRENRIYDYVDYRKTQKYYQLARDSNKYIDITCLLNFYGIYKWFART